MIRILFAEKGSGKSKQIISMANEAFDAAKGSIVFISTSTQYMYDVKRDIRFIDISRFDIIGPKMFYGFLCGIVAQDYDLEGVFVDGFLKIVKHDIETLEELFTQLKKFTEDCGITVTLSISGNPSNIPAFLKEYI